MKKFALLTVLVIIMSIFNSSTVNRPVEVNTYTTYGVYYSDGVLITEDGNEWLYYDESMVVQDGMYCEVEMSDNGTPDNIYDDIVLGLKGGM